MRVMRGIAGYFPTRRGKCQRQKHIDRVKVPRYIPHSPHLDGSFLSVCHEGHSRRVSSVGSGLPT